ncbi:hypothetical protein M5K25_006994 [Dendrobium thyrsiflorum]|uniref:Uncharacterized protein n=1 Tax=Dendrobium thyrsiflorum TaxID=117978 RepID=A0ABD0VD02_DENTH
MDSPQLLSHVLLGSDHLHRQWSQPRVGVGTPVGDVAANRHHLHHHHIQLQYVLPYIRPPYLWCRSALLVHLPYNIHLSNILLPLPYLLSLPLLVSGSLSDGATGSPVEADLREAAQDVTPKSISLSFLSSSLRGLGLQTCFPFHRDLSMVDPRMCSSGVTPQCSPSGLFLPFVLSTLVKDSLSLGGVLLTSAGWLLLALGQARWKDELKIVVEPEVQHFSFSSASWLASLQMRKSQHCYSRMQVTRNDGSSCNNGREVEATKLDGSSGIPSLNDSVRQLDPGSLSQLDSHWGVL